MSARTATGRPSLAELRGAALDYAARGVPVLPLRGKLPLLPAAHRPGDPLYQQCKGKCGQLLARIPVGDDAVTDHGDARIG